MNICFVLDSFITGGAERVAVTLCNEFALKNINVSIVLTSSNDLSSTYKLDKKVSVFSVFKDKNNFFARSKRLRKTILSISPDVVIGFLPHVCIYLWHSLRRTNIKLILSERNDPAQMRTLYKFLLKHIFKKADGTVFQNEDSLKWYFKKPKKPSIIIFNPVNLNDNRYCVVNKKNTIVYVGRLVEQKNIPMLLNCFKRLSEKYDDAVLKIYGEGNLKSELIEKCKALKIYKKVMFCGVNMDWHKEEVDAKMFVLPSKREGMPNALEEALCLGIPSVSTDCPSGGARLLMQLFKCDQLLAKVDDENDFYKKMCDCYSSPTVNKEIVEKNRINLSKEKIASEWLRFIEMVNNNE